MSVERRPEELAREPDLIDGARRGDPAAFCDLVRPYLPTLRARARRMAASLGCEAGEIVQEALLRSYASIENYQPQYTFAQYLFGISRYAALQVARNHRRAPSGGLDESAPGERDLLSEIDENRVPLGLQALAGVRRFPDPDVRVRARHRLLALLTVLLDAGGYPHQQISFGFSIVLWGKAKRRARRGRGAPRRADKVEVTGDPDRVVRELGPRPLEDSARDFRDELSVRESLDPAVLEEAFAPLDFRLGLRGRELFTGDPRSRLRHSAMDDVRIGDSKLSQYFDRRPERAVAEWCRLVKERVRRRVLADASTPGSLAPRPPTGRAAITGATPAKTIQEPPTPERSADAGSIPLTSDSRPTDREGAGRKPTEVCE